MSINIIPAIDVIDGKCVRLSQGDYALKKIYNESPLDVARAFEDCGCTRLHLVDLDGARSHHIVNYRVLDAIAGHTGLTVDFGGGLKSDDDLRIAFECGAVMVTGGSIAVSQPETFTGWLTKYGADRIILGADSRDGFIATQGWLNDSDKSVVPFVQHYHEQGVTKVISTDIACDGMLQGPSVDLYRRILEAVPGLHLIASGGVGDMSHVEVLEEAGVPEVIVGKAIYENHITLNDLLSFNKTRK